MLKFSSLGVDRMTRIAVLSAIPVNRLPPSTQDFVFWNIIGGELGWLLKSSAHNGMILTSPTTRKFQYSKIKLSKASTLLLYLIPKYSQVRTHKTGKLSLFWNLLMDFVFLLLHVFASLIIVVRSRAKLILDMGPYLSSFSATLVSILLKKPLITWKRGNPIRNVMLHSLSSQSFLSNIVLRLFTILEIISIRKAALVICDSSETVKMFECYAKGQVVLLPTSVDLEKFEAASKQRDSLRARLNFTANDFVLVYAGRLETGKGISSLIEAIYSVKDQKSPFQLLIAGSGSLEQELRSLVQRYEIHDRVQFLGAIPYENMPQLLHASDSVILLSSAEGTPRILLEALACGKPIIASNVGGIAEMFVTNPEIGQKVINSSPENIISAIHATFLGEQDPTKKTKNALMRRNFIATHYSLDVIGTRFIEYIQKVLLIE